MSNHHCWDDLQPLLNSDKRVQDRFDGIECFEYRTGLLEQGNESSLPQLKDVATLLATFLAPRRFAGQELVLVGHSQGGLVIQAYFSLLLKSQRAKELRWIRQAIFVATPNLGSIFLDRTRRFTDRMLRRVTGVFLNPQERLLRALQPEIMEIQKLIMDRIVAAAPATIADDRWPVPLQCFYGSEDRIVLQVSAQSFFSPDICTALNAGHTDIVSPKDENDERYVKLVDALLNPIGHANVVEVDRYETHLRIEPYAAQQGIEVRYGTHTRMVHTDNRAILTRRMTVAQRNRCHDICVIPYLTNPSGFVRPVTPELLDALGAKDRTRYEMEGREFNFSFTPRNGHTHEVQIEILRGFEQGDRRIHFHLGTTHYFRSMIYTLDLSAYLQLGFRVTQSPRLHYEDTEEHRCEHIWSRASYDPSVADAIGIWQWELRNVRQGAIGLTWEVDQ